MAKHFAWSAAIERAIQARQANLDVETVDLVGRSHAAEMDELRIVEGQQLMLVDLERCTRCGECINACVDGHDDGNTRLYLEGPTIGKYLIPMTCRECVDPYCMRDCPVSSIYRGSDGEMVIADWCIGCENCATSCPFGSIHMNPLSGSEIEQQRDHPDVKPVNQRATVCDLCASTPSGDPLCVYACPHDAAIRMDGRTFYELQN
jgi:Fe-S-cluster-containing hydrogenase component 2